MNVKTVSAKQQERSDAALLNAFLHSGSQQAFESVVRKYLGMVLGIAARKTGNHELAKEIAQNVFAILARKAANLAGRPNLAGWIHRVTLIECAEAMRREMTHQKKIKAATEQLQADCEHSSGLEVWREALPILDEGIAALSKKDGEIIFLRFFERKSFREIGAALGKSDDAAQKQAERALEKLCAWLKRKGVAISATAIAPCLAVQFEQTASAALAESIARTAISSAPMWSAKIIILKTLTAMSYEKSRAAIVTALLLAIPLTLQWRENRLLHEALRRPEPSEVSARITEVVVPSRAVAVPSPALDNAEAKSLPDLDEITRAWELALLTPDPIERSQRISQLLLGLTAEAAPLIARAFERSAAAGIRFDEEQRLFLRAWGRLSGLSAVEYAIRRWGRNDSFESTAALAGWASVDPQQAQQWVQALPESAGKENLVLGLLDGWSTLDFHAAAAFAETRPHSQATDGFRELLGQRALRAGGIPAAQQWVLGIADNPQNSDYKRRAFDDVIQAMLYRDPAAAAGWIAQYNGQPFVGNETITRTAAKLAETSPAAALNWIGSVPGEDQHTGNAGAILRNWAKEDLQAAGLWLKQNMDHPGYDAMAENYAFAIRPIDPSRADAWANTIQDKSTREGALRGLDPQKRLVHTIALDKSARIWEARFGTSFAPDGGDLRESPPEWKFPAGTNPHGPEFQSLDCAKCHNQ